MKNYSLGTQKPTALMVNILTTLKKIGWRNKLLIPLNSGVIWLRLYYCSPKEQDGFEDYENFLAHRSV